MKYNSKRYLDLLPHLKIISSTEIYLRGKLLKQYSIGGDYLKIVVKQKSYLVHRLMAFKYLPNPLNKDEINHKNSDRSDNRIENIEWCTHSENIKHGYDYGFAHGPKHFTGRNNEKHPRSKPVLQISLDGMILNEYPCQKEAERKTGTRQGDISKCCRGKLNKTNGYKWKFKVI